MVYNLSLVYHSGLAIPVGSPLPPEVFPPVVPPVFPPVAPPVFPPVVVPPVFPPGIWVSFVTIGAFGTVIPLPPVPWSGSFWEKFDTWVGFLLQEVNPAIEKTAINIIIAMRWVELSWVELFVAFHKLLLNINYRILNPTYLR